MHTTRESARGNHMWWFTVLELCDHVDAKIHRLAQRTPRVKDLPEKQMIAAHIQMVNRTRKATHSCACRATTCLICWVWPNGSQSESVRCLRSCSRSPKTLQTCLYSFGPGRRAQMTHPVPAVHPIMDGAAQSALDLEWVWSRQKEVRAKCWSGTQL